MKTCNALTVQKARGKRMLRNAIIATLAGFSLLVASFLVYAQFTNFFVAGLLLLVGTVVLGVGTQQITKAQTLLENTRYGILC